MEKFESNTVHDTSFNGLRNSAGTSTTNIYNPESQLLSGMIEANTFHDSNFNGLRNSVGTSAVNIYNPESQLLDGMIEANNFHDNSFNGLRNSVGTSTTNIYNPESQLLDGMINNNMFKRKKSSVSNNSYLMDLNHSQELDLSDDNLDEISFGYNKDLLSESDDNSENEGNINELLLMKKNSNKAPESVASELDAQSSIYTDTETQSEYSIESSRLDPETLNNHIWYYKQTPNSDDKLNQNNGDDQNYSDDDSSSVAENTAAIRQLKLHRYVSTNNLSVGKKDNSMLKRRTTIATSNYLNNNRLNNKRDITHGINENDIMLFSNKEFNTEVKENYFITDPSQDDFRTSMLLSKTGDASRKRRSEMSSNRNRTYSNHIVNENYSTIAPPLSSYSFKKLTSSNTKTNIANINSSKQPQLNSPMEVDHSTNLIHKSENINSNINNGNNTQTNTTKLSDTNNENSNQFYSIFMMAKDLFTFGKGKVKRTNTIKSTSSRSSIRKSQKKPSISRRRVSVKRKNTYNQTTNFHDFSEDDMTSMDTNKYYHRSSSSVALKNKSSNGNQTNNRKSNNISRNSSFLSASTRRSSYGKNKFYQNDFLNYSASNLSDSTGLELDNARKMEESFDLDVHHHNKNKNLRPYGVYPESYYSYHAPVSSIDGRSLYEDEEDEESVVSESDNGIGDNYNDYYDIRNKLTMQPITDSLSNYSAIFSDRYNSKFQKKYNEPLSSKGNEDNNKSLLKKLHSTSTIETSLSSKSLTPTVTNGNNNGHSDRMDEKSETTVEQSTVKGSTYGGDNRSVANTCNIATVSRYQYNKNNGYSTVSYNNKRNWDDNSCSSFSHYNENETGHLEISSMPEGIKDYSNYPSPIKQVPTDYYRLGVYMYITNPCIVQTRTMMERMFSAHTLYTITVKLLKPLIPMYRNDRVCTFTIHKRYRQFRSFYKEIHRKYKDSITDLPEFPKKTFFDRFDTNTIIDRANAFSKLLSFISLHPNLYNCPVLLTFLEITGSSNNRFANINSNVSRGNYQLENPSSNFNGKVIPFEGRNIAPNIPKLYDSIRHRQLPLGYYGHIPQSTLSLVGTSLNNLNSSSPNLNRNGHFNSSYSSFGKPSHTKSDILKNNNSYISSPSSSNEITESTKNESEALSSSKSVHTELSTTANQTTPKLYTVNLKNNELSENMTSKPPLVDQNNKDNSSNGNNNQSSNNSSQTLDQKSALIPNSPDANYSDATTPKITHAVTAITTITSPESPISINNDFLITPTPTQSTTNFATPLEGIEAKLSTKSTSSSASSLTTTIENSNLKIEIPGKKMNNTDSIDSTDSTITTGNVKSNNHSNFNDDSNNDITDSSILSSPISSPINFMNISTTTTATTSATSTATITSIPLVSSQSSKLKGKAIAEDETIEEKINSLLKHKSTSPTTTAATTSNIPPVSSQSSKLKGKAISEEETIEEKVNSIVKNKSTTPPPVIPRPRTRYRPGNTTYRTEDEMGPNYMHRYNQLQQIPGFQYLISEFPKLRSDQNKRYSSIF